MMNPILTANNLHKSFDDVKAVQGVSFQIAEGEAKAVDYLLADPSCK